MDYFGDILEARLSRRGFVKALAGAATVAALPISACARASTSSLGFTEIDAGLDHTHHIAQGYDAQLLMRWGDALLPNAPAFDPKQQTAQSQAAQFGFNNDFIAYFPLNGSTHGLLCVNHEYCAPENMFPGNRTRLELTDAEQAICMQSVGASVMEVQQGTDGWEKIDGKYNRRITASTPMRIAGPAAGHDRLKTSADPTGKKVLGTFANCAGGQTPWGTYLTCEENFDGFFFAGDYAGAEKDSHAAVGIGKRIYHRWDQIDERFSVQAEPNEANRFGWVVEIDPHNPDSMPVKHTAIGRYKHECATCVLAADGRVVVYSGDDSHFQFIYKFVSDGRYDPAKGKANSALLDTGTLYAARFHDDGSMQWLPLTYGVGPLTEDYGFNSQADVLIESRRAGKLLGATPMDRPEDVDVNPNTGRVYAAMTKNPDRKITDAVNRRRHNKSGYVLEMLPPDGDHAAERFGWELFIEGGENGLYGEETTRNGLLACPDNLAFDNEGRIWITTDGQESVLGRANAVYAADTLGKGRAVPRQFMRGPVGCEMTGPCFTPDGKTLFVSVQHPGERGTFDAPDTRWPDFDPSMPPRSAVMAIMKDDGGLIGS